MENQVTKERAELKAVETEIENIDSQIAQLITQRLAMYRKRAGIREALGLPVIDRQREALYVDRIRTLLGTQFGLSREFLGRLFKLIADECNRSLL